MYSEPTQDNRRDYNKRPSIFSGLSVWFRECIFSEPVCWPKRTGMSLSVGSGQGRRLHNDHGCRAVQRAKALHCRVCGRSRFRVLKIYTCESAAIRFKQIARSSQLAMAQRQTSITTCFLSHMPSLGKSPNQNSHISDRNSLVIGKPDASPMTESIQQTGHHALVSSSVQDSIFAGGKVLRQLKHPHSELASI